MKAAANNFTIGELAADAGVTPRTIRYYVSEGLLPPPGGSGPNRVYGREHSTRLMLIKRLQQEHLPLHEIKSRLARVTLAEMENLLRDAPPVRKRMDPRRLLAAVLNPGRAVEADMAEADMIREPAMLLREMVPAAAAQPPPAASPGLWLRVAVAPGVELHYEAGADPEREAQVQDILAFAAERLRLDTTEEPDNAASADNKGEV